MLGRTSRLLCAALLVVAVLAACGDDPDDEGSGSGGTGKGNGSGTEQTASDFQACEVTDTGGVDDKSFNQNAYEGATRAEDELGIEAKVLESTAETDYEPNINAFIDQGCELVVTVGFLLGDATAAAAEAHTDQKFAIVDNDFFDTDKNEDVEYDNVKELTFATDQAAFLAGYLSAGMSESGKVGTYGGLNIPTVSIFMEGFRQGVEKYNEDQGADVQLIGWDGSDGLFTGDFEDQDKGRTTTETLISEGADIIMPVAGPVGLGSVEAAKAAGDVKLIWVDTDGCVSVPASCDLFLSSVQKKMDNAVYDAIKETKDDKFKGGKYVGTLENDGVALAPFHDHEDEVPQELADKIDEYKQQIIDGELKIGA